MENWVHDELVMLSVVIISHNQREVLKRCIDSVLQQKTTFTTEIIVSDDRSKDGTREMLLNEYRGKVIPTFFDSDNYNTSFTLERSGYNRLNGLKIARGKYLIHTDGDDFFKSTDLFQQMVEVLENHPECNLCCQNYCIVDSDNINGPHIPQIKSDLLKGNKIISAQEFFSQIPMLVNACYCMRRGNNFNNKNLVGGTYDDNYITARYVGNGKVAILDRCDFIYVHYGHSTCATMSPIEKNLIFQPAVGIVELAPSIAGAMLKRCTASFYMVSKYAVLRRPVSEKIKSFCRIFDGFIYHNLSNEYNFGIWLRYLIICVFSYVMSVTRIKPKLFLKLLYRLAIGKTNQNVMI